MDNARASRLRDVDLDITPSSFSRDTTDHHELSRYILKDLKSCPVGCRIIVCVRPGAHGNPTAVSYSDQAKSFASSRYGTICRSTLREEGTSIDSE